MKKWLTLALLLFLVACNKDEIGPQQIDFEPSPSVSGHLLVLCEGLFNFGTASISAYDPESGEVFQQQFSAANDGQPLGDILQCVLQVEDELWWVVNNSGKIEVTDKDLHSLQTITGLESPRYLAYSEGSVYTTDLASGSISVIDADSYSVVGELPTQGWTEEIFASDGHLAYALPSEQTVVFDDLANASNIQQILTGSYQDMTFTNDESLGPIVWSLAAEDATSHIRWNLLDGTMINNQSFDSPMNHLTGFETWVAMAGDSLYQLTSSSTIEAIGNLDAVQTLYGFEWIPQMQRFAVADAVNYTSNGKVHLYQENGSYDTTFAVGALPNGFVWVE